MLGIFNSINIDGMDFYRPNDFELTREDIYAGGYTTCQGSFRADTIGWKYADYTLSWDTLPDAMLQKLNSLNGAVSMVFEDSDGTHTESIVRLKYSNMPTRLTAPDGNVLWRNVNLEIMFINAHSFSESE